MRLLSCLLFAAALQGQPYDVLIANGRVYDGTGGSWYRADVAIRGDAIAAIGNLRGATAKVVIDARDMAIAPGFIDIHSHGRRGIFDVPLAENYIRQGVTAFIEGQDGGSPLPLGPYLEKLAALHAAVNIGMLVGQGSIRTAVVGQADRKATAGEIARMQEMMRQGMRQGAFGFSTGLYYVPGTFTPTEELIALARVAGELGGIHVSHQRDDAAHLLDSVKETIRIGEEGRLPTQVTHHKVIGKGNWGKSTEALALIEAARARGVDVTVDQYPYTASSTGISALFPHWSLEGGRAELLKRINDPALRPKIKAAIAQNILEDRGGGDPKNVVLASCGFDPGLAGKSLADLAAAHGREPNAENGAEEALTLEAKGDCVAVYHALSEQDVENILRYPFTMVASDGGVPVFGKEAPHPRSYGAFARVLGRYVRERKTISLEDAVRRMSALPASRLKIMDRGLLRPGMKADVTIFDPAAVADNATFTEPHQYAVGVVHVFVNGTAVLRDGRMTGARPGRVLYGPARQ
jgi:N-acyl-D-amino-acid deacylase